MRSCAGLLISLFALCILCHREVFGKVFERCELARLLKDKHRLSIDEVANWVCIAQHQSNFNSGLRTGAPNNGAHGLFQISDQFWCSPPGSNDACGVSCDRLRDDDLSDDIACVQRIYDEHQRISGDGYNAWTMYPRFCKGRARKSIEECFDTSSPKRALDHFDFSLNTLSFGSTKQHSKVYSPCELAKELRYKHKIPLDQIATWVCIAKHESNFNTSAIGRLNADGSGDHGLFQISDIYWCSPPGEGWACGLSCSQLEDSDITDDVECIKRIYEEHTRLSGDGFNAWTTYQPYCKERSQNYIQSCFDDIDGNQIVPTKEVSFPEERPYKRPSSKPSKSGKVYTPCELAAELRNKHKIPLEQIATWVCIAKHESNFNTSAIGRLNLDGSGDHGLFQISDIYWCSPPGNGWACGLSCSDLEDSDITDDVECMKKIYEEHQRLSGDGFNAWAVYKPYCKGQSKSYVEGCFSDVENNALSYQPFTPDRGSHRSPSKPVNRPGKVYTECELAKELRYKHQFPLNEIPIWVCIAKHESNFNTSAIGRLNGDGSEDHGLFQISDIYWCSPPGKGWACGLSCSDLEDSDITDDVECIKKVHAEHTRLSGDGFNAWSVYKPHCKDKSNSYIRGCFDDFDGSDINSLAPGQENNLIIPVQETNSIVPVREIKNAINGPSKIYSRCELAGELRVKHKMPESQIATWVCIAEHESNLNTGAMNSGSGDHGLFQISELFWCDTAGRGKECRKQCSEFRDNDISDDVECIKKIYKEHMRLSGDGFNAWVVYPRCKGRSEEYIRGCKQTTFDFPKPTKRPSIFVPAITAPTNLNVYREQFARFPTTTKTSAFTFKFADTTRKPFVENARPISNSQIFDDKFFSTGFSFDRTTTTIQPEREYSGIFRVKPKPTVTSKDFGTTAGSRFNLPSVVLPSDRLYTTQKPFELFKQPTRISTFDPFEAFTKPIRVTPKPKTSIQTPERITTSRANRFDVFAAFDATSRFSTTRKYSQPSIVTTTRAPFTYQFGQKSKTALTTATPLTTNAKINRFSGFSTLTTKSNFPAATQTSFTSRPVQISRLTPARNQFISTTASSRYDLYSLGGTASTIISPQSETTLLPKVYLPGRAPKTYTNIFDFYFDLYNIQRHPIDIPTPKFQAATAFVHQGTTRNPLAFQDISTTQDFFGNSRRSTSTVQPIRLTTPAYNRFRFDATKEAFSTQRSLVTDSVILPKIQSGYKVKSRNETPFGEDLTRPTARIFNSKINSEFKFGSSFGSLPSTYKTLNQDAESGTGHSSKSLDGKFSLITSASTRAPFNKFGISPNDEFSSSSFTSEPLRSNFGLPSRSVQFSFGRTQSAIENPTLATTTTTRRPSIFGFDFTGPDTKNNIESTATTKYYKNVFDEVFDRFTH